MAGFADSLGANPADERPSFTLRDRVAVRDGRIIEVERERLEQEEEIEEDAEDEHAEALDRQEDSDDEPEGQSDDE